MMIKTIGAQSKNIEVELSRLDTENSIVDLDYIPEMGAIKVVISNYVQDYELVLYLDFVDFMTGVANTIREKETELYD